MKILILAMFVSLVTVLAATAHGATLHTGTYYVNQLDNGYASVVDTHDTARVVRATVLPRHARHEGAVYIVCAPLVIRASAHVSSDRAIAYRNQGRTYTASTRPLVVGGEIGGIASSSDIVDALTLASRCESVGPRLDGTYVTICDGIVMSVDDGSTVHVAPFGYAVNAQIGRR